MLQRTRTTWRGIRRHGAGWQAEVRVVGHPRSVRQFPMSTDPREMQKWRADEKRRLGRLRPPATAGTFAADAKHYLLARAAMPGIDERRRHIGLWVAEFGARPRHTIQPWEIATVRDRWLTEGPRRVWRRWAADGEARHGGRWVDLAAPLSASQVNNRLRALENLWTVLDGRHAPNPVREVSEAEEPESEARGLPYDLVEAILAGLPERGRARKGQARPTCSLTKLRLRVIAYTGLSHAQLGALDLTADIDEAAGLVRVPRRKKGKGVASHWRPVPREGLEALAALRAAGGQGPFSASAARQSFRRACRKVGLSGVRPYDLRHSYATEIFAKTGDLTVTQLLMGHGDAATTLRYAKRAVPPVLAEAIARIRAAGGFAAPGNAPPSASDSPRETSE